jgi:hypothetical protein
MVELGELSVDAVLSSSERRTSDTLLEGKLIVRGTTAEAHSPRRTAARAKTMPLPSPVVGSREAAVPAGGVPPEATA